MTWEVHPGRLATFVRRLRPAQVRLLIDLIIRNEDVPRTPRQIAICLSFLAVTMTPSQQAEAWRSAG